MPAQRVVSVFCGCGGLDLGFLEAGFDLVYACDNDPAAVACYRRNLEDSVFVRDATSDAFHDDIKSIGRCDVVLGGFKWPEPTHTAPARNGEFRITAQNGPTLFDHRERRLQHQGRDRQRPRHTDAGGER